MINLAKPKKLKKSKSKSYLKKKADMLFSLQVREKGYCELAGKDSITCNGNLQCMHIVGRANHNLRWDLRNALCGCAGHHMYYTNHPFEFHAFIMAFYPDRYRYLNKERLDIWDKDIQAVIERLNDKNSF